MTVDNLIAPFPDGIDREVFGHWLSGFTDGEGFFGLEITQRTRTGHAQFAIQLRRDEWLCLDLIRSFLGCGRMYLMTGPRAGNPMVAYKAFRTADIRDIIIPNFERYPLRAKKAYDFLLWKEAARLMIQARSRGNVGMGKGRPKWMPEEKEEFARLAALLKAGRKYNSGMGRVSPP